MVCMFVGGPATAVSWYHIFLSLNQYYTSLRREVPSSADMSVGPQGPHHRGITPQELEGLVTVLKLCRVVSENVSFFPLLLKDFFVWQKLVCITNNRNFMLFG